MSTVRNNLIEQYRYLIIEQDLYSDLLLIETLSDTQRSCFRIKLELINNDVTFIENAFLGNKMILENEIAEYENIYKNNRNFEDIGMAVRFICERVNNFGELPEKIIPTFPITQAEIDYLEIRVRKTLIENHKHSGVNKGDNYENFLEHSVRCGLNFLLEDETHPRLKRYLKDWRDLCEQENLVY